MIHIDQTTEILLYAFFICWIIQMFYYLFVYSRFLRYKNKNENTTESLPPVSVVICAKNEAENLKKYLPLILEQDYPDFEVIVVDDCSTDETNDILNNFKEKYPQLKSTFLKEQEKFSHGKKLALTIGIKAAKNEWLVLTDADCYPVTNQWLKSIATHYNEHTSIVLGYGGYEIKKGFLNKLIRYESAIIALQYFSYALCGVPYMGVGRNLSYRSSLFFNNKGFASHAKLDSGDDDLFVNETATRTNVDIEPFFKAHTRSAPSEKFSKWIDQKKRHFTTFKKYKRLHKLLLGLEIFSRVFFYFLFILLLIFKINFTVVLSLFLFRTIVQMIIYKKTFKLFNERKIFLISFIFDIIFPFINLSIYLSNRIKPQKRWR